MSDWRPTQIVTLGIVVYTLWLILSGIYTPWMLGVGVVCSALAVFIAVRMELVDHEGVPVIHLTNKVFTYIPWLLLDIIRSNIAVTRIIWDPKLPIRPIIMPVRALQNSDLGRVIFTNSISLTPGAFVLSVVGREIHLHVLDGEAIGDMDNGEMNRRVAELVREEVAG